jgi:hypothetical protein
VPCFRRPYQRLTSRQTVGARESIPHPGFHDSKLFRQEKSKKFTSLPSVFEWLSHALYRGRDCFQANAARTVPLIAMTKICLWFEGMRIVRQLATQKKTSKERNNIPLCGKADAHQCSISII